MSSTPEKTFRSFSQSQGQNYAQIRRDYHQSLYDSILNYAASSGTEASESLLLDVGCGPGTAARHLAPHFDHVVAIDPSEGMIATAKSISSPNNLRFEVSTAEALGSDLARDPVKPGSVDLITAATAAHWFDMPAFWAKAAEMLKPGGTVALWTSGGMSVSPDTPNAAKVQAAIDGHEEYLKDFFIPGNILTRELYVNLPLPWTVDPAITTFDKSTFVRQEWGTGAPGALSGNEFVSGPQYADMKTLEMILGTGSPVIRWREAHPEDVCTERDVVRMIRRDVERALHEAGVPEGKEVVHGGVKGALLLVKKSV